MLRVFLNSEEFLDININRYGFAIFMRDFESLVDNYPMPQIYELIVKIHESEGDKDKINLLNFLEKNNELYLKLVRLSQMIGASNLKIICESIFKFYAAKVHETLINLSQQQRNQLIDAVEKDFEEFRATAIDRAVMMGTYTSTEQALNDYMTYLQEYGGQNER